jgi:hypothetical protein
MVILDRFQGEWAIVELKGKTFSIPKKLIPKDAVEGDVLNIHLTINKEETENRKKKIQGLMDELFE